MDMHEADLFKSLSQPPAAPHGGPLGWLILAVTAAAWVFMNIWSVNLVASGIWSMRLYPPSFSEGLVLLFAMALQAIVAVFGLLTPAFFSRFTSAMWWPLALVFCVCLVGFEAYHAVFAQYKNSVGPSLVAAKRAELANLHAKASELGAQIPANHQRKLESFEALAGLSEAGKDVTGVTGCGTVCKGYRAQFAQAKATYAHLGLPTVPAPVPVGDDLRASFVDLQGRTQSLRSAAVDLGSFFQAVDKSAAPASVTEGVAELVSRVDDMARQVEGLSKITPETLALRETNAAFKSLAQGQMPSVEARLPLVYGILPALSVLVLSMFLRVQLGAMGGSPMGLAGLGFEVARERAKSPLLEKLKTLRMNNFKAWVSADMAGKLRPGP